MKALIFLALLSAPTALAQGADFPDASLPDASVGEGGADRDNPEGEDGRSNGPCLSTKDCERGFSCVSSRCVYTGVRTAGGCAGGTGALLFTGAFLGLLWRSKSVRQPPDAEGPKLSAPSSPRSAPQSPGHRPSPG